MVTYLYKVSIMRSRLLYPFMIVVIVLGIVALFSLRYAPEGQSPNNIMFVDLDGQSERIIIEDMEFNCGIEERSIYDIWLGTTKKYSFIKVSDLVQCVSNIPDEDLQHSINVVFTNIQGKTMSIPLTNILEYEDSFLLAIKYRDEDLQIDFSNNPESGGPSRLIIDYANEFISENYGPEYWIWCVYKISLVKGPVA